jgi:hypothetical protein
LAGDEIVMKTDDFTPSTGQVRHVSLSGIALWISGVLLVYILSAGPAVKLADRGILDPSHLETFYVPLIWLAETSEPVRDILIWYIFDLWNNEL